MSKTKLKMAAQTGGRILVVDDEEKNRRLLADLLSAEGYTVQTVNDGLEALQLVSEFRPEAILLDVMMPKLDGLETCHRLKADPVTASIPILLTTALHARADRLKGIQAGANDFLTKPLDIEEIRLRVKNAVHTKRLYDQMSEAHEQLHKLQGLQNNLTQFVVHDLRSPLTGIMGHLDLLKMGYIGPLNKQQQESVESAFACADQLREMISSLLDVARIENGQMPLHLEPFDLQHLAREALATLGPLFGSVRVSVDVPPVLPRAICDGELIQRVLVNLLGNATKFMSAGGEIRISIAPNEGDWKISVTDTGPGIPPQYHEKIFDKFGQVDAQSGRKKYSTGLGLTFCKLAVEAHGGRIGVESRVGQGSTFWFTLPVRKDGTTEKE